MAKVLVVTYILYKNNHPIQAWLKVQVDLVGFGFQPLADLRFGKGVGVCTTQIDSWVLFCWVLLVKS